MKFIENQLAQTDQVYYMVCLVETDSDTAFVDGESSTECRVTFFCSEWRMDNNGDSQKELSDNIYLYQADKDTYKSVLAGDVYEYKTSKINKTIITIDDLQKYQAYLEKNQTEISEVDIFDKLATEEIIDNYKQDINCMPQLIWNKCADGEVPKTLLQLIEQQFYSDGFKAFQGMANAVGMIDEKAVREGILSNFPHISIINNKRLFLSAEDQKALNDSKSPCLLGTVAHVAHLQDLELWRIDKIYHQEYANPDKQTLDKTYLSKLGQPYKNSKYTLISHKWIVEHCAGTSQGHR